MVNTSYANGTTARDVEQLGNRLTRLFGGEMGAWPTTGADGWHPAISLAETGEEMRLTVELPGLQQEHVDVRLENNVLTITGDKHPEVTATDGSRYHVQERAFGPFRRVFRLPLAVKAEEISARLEHGLLSIRIPKAPEARSRRIEIRAGTERNIEK